MTDLPHTLFTAIRLGLTFLSFEELPEEEQPPKRIWMDNERLHEWFNAVKKRRDEKYGDGGSKSIEDPVQNDAAKLLMTS